MAQNVKQMPKGEGRDREFRTRVGLAEESRAKVAKILNARLADAADMHMQAKFAHWNVKGKDFYQLHLLFDKIAEDVEKQIDQIAERITALGHRAVGTLRQAAKSSSLPEYPIDITRGEDHVRALAERLSIYGNAAREGIDQTDELEDMVTSDLLTEIVGVVDQDLYFLEAHLQG